jgi:hypothetical protein
MAPGGHIDKNGNAPYTEHERTISFQVPGAAFGYRKDTLLVTNKLCRTAERRVPMGNINKKVDKLIAKRQWDKLLHNLGETNGDSKMKIAKACGVSGGSGCIDLLSVILNDREASDDLLLETIDSLGKIGNDRCITLLRYFRENVDQSKTPMISAVDSSVRKIKVRVAEMERMTQ